MTNQEIKTTDEEVGTRLIKAYRNSDYDAQFESIIKGETKVCPSYRNADYDNQFEPTRKLLLGESIVYSGDFI